MSTNDPSHRGQTLPDRMTGLTFQEMMTALRGSLRPLLITPIAIGALVAIATGFIEPTYTARTTFMPPQQAQNGMAQALASLAPLAAIAGGSTGLASSADRYVGLLESVTITDRIIDRFKLMDVYESRFKVDARQALNANVLITVGKKDGLISIVVDDTSPQRAAEIANQYVEELRAITQTLATTEAQQRRVFFEQQLKLSQERLTAAQFALESSGFNPGVLRTELRPAADAYARLRAEVTAAEVRLQTLRGTRTERSAEVLQQQSELSALRSQLSRLEQAQAPTGESDYVGNYREFKYQEALFELYARQFEVARVDESREGTLIQVVDRAAAPERKSKPKRLVAVVLSSLVALVVVLLFVLVRAAFRAQPPHGVNRLDVEARVR